MPAKKKGGKKGGQRKKRMTPKRLKELGYKKHYGSYREVWSGTAYKTTGGLKKKDLMKRKGRIVSKKKSQNLNPSLKKWNKCVMRARRELGVEGFVPVGGRSREGKELYRRAKECYEM